MRVRRNELFAIIALGTYCLCFTFRGAQTYFNTDDVTNLYLAYVTNTRELIKGSLVFWSGHVRPLGALYYRLVYEVVGFNPFPFHVGAFAIILANLGLEYYVVASLSSSRWIAFVCVMIDCFHGRMWDIYASVGTIYDILSKTFCLTALAAYVRLSRPSAKVSLARLTLFAAICVGAVDSKEVGVSIPLLLLCYEISMTDFSRPLGQANYWKTRWRLLGVAAAVSIAFSWCRLARPGPLSDLPAYTLTVTWSRYLETTRHYLNYLVYDGKLGSWEALAVLGGCLAVAAVLRSRLMILGWLYYLATLLPMSFATPRLGYVLYVPFTGVALFVAGLMQILRVRFLGFFGDRRLGRTRGDVMFTASVVALVAYIHAVQLMDVMARGEAPGGQAQIRAIAEGIGSLYGSMPRGSHLLLVNDPLGSEPHLPMFTICLRYRDASIQVTKLAWDREAGAFERPNGKFDHTFVFEGNEILEVTARDSEMPRSFVRMGDMVATLNIVREIGPRTEDGRSRWAFQSPGLRFLPPDRTFRFAMKFSVPEVIVQQTGPLRMACAIGSEPAEGVLVRESGEYEFISKTHESGRAGEIVDVRCLVENPYRAEDGSRLSFRIERAGLLSAASRRMETGDSESRQQSHQLIRR